PRHRQPRELNEPLRSKSLADESGAIRADTVLGVPPAFFRERSLYPLEIRCDLFLDLVATGVEVNRELDRRAGRLADIVLRMAIGSTPGGNTLQFTKVRDLILPLLKYDGNLHSLGRQRLRLGKFHAFFGKIE